MTREEAREMGEVMLAYASGKQIEIKLREGIWIDAKNPCFNGDCYRVKPELKYRPFQTVEEVESCFFEIIILESGKYVITGAFVERDELYIVFGKTDYNASHLFTIATFKDGSPVGVKC